MNKESSDRELEKGEAYFREREKSLQDSLKKYETIVNDIEDGVGETDLRGNLLFANDAGCRIWGYSREEIVGSNYKSYIDEEGAKFIKEAYNKVYKTGLPNRFIHEIIRKDGLRRTVEDSVSPVRDADGNVCGFRAVQRDVTDRVEAEKKFASHRRRLEAIFASVKDAIITVDPDLRVIEANKSTEKICGINSKEITGKIFSECLSQCDKTCCDVLKQTLKQKTAISEYRIECGHQKQYQQLVSVNSSPLLDYHGNFTEPFW
ncbi:MAG: PAS domain S-box protein [Thermodesulfobacteriota bacterium]|jgi:PAS domain S-box-containing protein